MRRDLAGADPTDPRTGQNLASLSSPAKTVMFVECSGLYAPVNDPGEVGGANGVTSGVTNGDGGNLYYNNNNVGGRLETGWLGYRDSTADTLKGTNRDIGFAAKTGRHTDGSNFLMTDCHAKWLRGTQVSAGRNAMASDCNEDANPTMPDCNGGATASWHMSEGTDGSRFAATFSTK